MKAPAFIGRAVSQVRQTSVRNSSPSTPGEISASTSARRYLEKYPALARTLIPSRFGLITILRKASSFKGSVG